MVERVEKELSVLKASYLSLGGRLTLIKSVLANLPMYYLSWLRCLISVINQIEKLQWDFLWHGRNEEKKFHLVDWSSVCRLKVEGGLGIRPLRQMNQALLGKWLWRLGDESEGLWKELVEGKYGVLRNGWDVREVSYKASPIWKGILSVKDNFMMNITYRMGMGEKILLWKDNWIGDRPLANHFPNLCSRVVEKEAKVNCYLCFSGEQKVWTPILRRIIREDEEGHLMSLLNILSGVHIAEGGEDIRLWKASKDGSFRVSCFFSAITGRINGRNPMASIWKIKAPPRAIVFGWLVLRKRILTMDNLRRRRKVVVNGCPMCLTEEETVDHLLLNCKVAQMLWRLVIDCFGCSWVLPNCIVDLFQAWKSLI